MYVEKHLPQNFFRKKSQVTLEGIRETFDCIHRQNNDFIVFKNSNENDEYYLYSLETGKLLLKSIGREIRIFFGSALKNFFVIKQNDGDGDEYYLFEIDTNYINKDCKTTLDIITDVKVLDELETFKLHFVYEKFFNVDYGIFLKKSNEVVYFDINKEMQSFKIPFDIKGNKEHSFSLEIYHSEYSRNGLVIQINEKLENNYTDGIYLNVYDFDSKTFMFKEFINEYISTYGEYNGKLYIITQSLKVLDEFGRTVGFDPLAEKLYFHEKFPYVVSERKDRYGLISLEKSKVIFKPIYLDIMVDTENFFVLESEKGAYKKICVNDI